MPFLPAPQLASHLATGALHAVYVVTSAEVPQDRYAKGSQPQRKPSADPHALLAAAHAIEARALAGGDPMLDRVSIDYLDGDREATGVHQLIAHELRSVSLFGGRRVVTVVHCDKLEFAAAGATKAKSRKKQVGDDPLEQLLQHVEPGAGQPPFVLILVAEQLDRRRKGFKLLADQALVVEVPPLSAPELQAWLQDEAAPHGIGVDSDVAAMLFSRLGTAEPARLRQTGARVLLEAGPGGRATARMVADSVPLDRETAVWDLTNAVAAGDPVKAMLVLHRMTAHATSTEQGREVRKILGALIGHYSALLHAVAGLLARKSPYQVATETGLHAFRVEKLFAQAHGMHPRDVELALASVAEAELVVTSSAMGDSRSASVRWLEQLVLALCHRRPLRRRRPMTVMDTL
jgi:DNA polymerase III delta subunit